MTVLTLRDAVRELDPESVSIAGRIMHVFLRSDAELLDFAKQVGVAPRELSNSGSSKTWLGVDCQDDGWWIYARGPERNAAGKAA